MERETSSPTSIQRALDILREDHPVGEFCDKCWAIDHLEEQLETAMSMLREVNGLLDVGHDYDVVLMGQVFDWWQAQDGPRELLDEGFRTRQQSLRASSPASSQEDEAWEKRSRERDQGQVDNRPKPYEPHTWTVDFPAKSPSDA